MWEIAHYGKSFVAIFRDFFASINQAFILAGEMGPMLCLKVIIAHRFTCGERKICQNIKESQNIMKIIVALEGAFKA